MVDGVDACPVASEPALRAFYLHDLNSGLPRLDYAAYDYLLMLDVIDLASPELFLDTLRSALSENSSAEIIISTANIAFFITRFMLFIGQFNYGKRGILDLTHTRLFTFGSFERAIQQAGFDILERKGVPGPYPLALGDRPFSRLLVRINRLLIPISRGLFSTRSFSASSPSAGLELLLRRAQDHSQKRAEEIDRLA